MPRIETKSVEVNTALQAKDRELADQIRSELDAYNIKAIDVMGTIGAGKTTLLEKIAERLAKTHPILVVNGDLATNIDADRVGRHGATTIQINTGRGCHLHARWIRKVIDGLGPEGLAPYKDGFLFIENVGNLICPSGFDVGAHMRMVVTSVTEGPYHVQKHPVIYKISEVAVVNKVELAEVMEVSLEKLEEDAVSLNKDIRVVFTSMREGTGLEDVMKALHLPLG